MRRLVLLLSAVTAMIALAVLAQPKKKPGLLLLDWASRASAERPPVAVLIELGVKDKAPTRWDGRAVVAGAKVVRREGYRFRPGDKVAADGSWEASSRRPLRLPKLKPAIARLEGIDSIGVVLHLADVTGDAKLTLEAGEKHGKVVVPLAGVLAGKRASVWDGAAVVRLVSTAVPLSTGKTEDDFPAAAYGPDGTLWLAYISYHLKDESRRVQQRPLKEQPANFRALDTPEFGDQLFVRYRRKGKWSAPLALTGEREDLVRCAVAVEGGGTAWVVYSANRKGRYDLYARPVGMKHARKGSTEPAPGPEQRLTTRDAANLGPVACTDQAGNVRVAYQAWDRGGPLIGAARIALFTCQEGKWRSGVNLGGRLVIPSYYIGGKGNLWHPVVTAGPTNEVLTAFDVYDQGDYDVRLHLETPTMAANRPVMTSSRFEARPSACYDAKARLWIAYEEGPERWGGDFGALDDSGGNPLYNERSVRVVCLDGGKLFRPAAELPTSKNPRPGGTLEGGSWPRYEHAPRYSNPRLGLDGKGRLWLSYRQKFGARYSTNAGSYWLTFARRLDGDRWSEPIEVHHSDGLLDHRPVLLPHPAGGLLVLHNGDERYTTPQKMQNRVFESYIDLPGAPVEPKLVAHESGKKDPKLVKLHEEHAAAVKRLRAYRVEAGGKKYQLLRGEFHRHTEMSWDGGSDGSLEDMFRYALDAAALDWIGNGDHDNGAGREYSWWLTQKLTDAYTVAGNFQGMFCYERSVAYPHGHRNCVFARRGIRTLPRLAQPDPDRRVAGIHTDDTKMLYRYLKELGGICSVHTSATSMGTDWRDNDPEVEPVVEIYQGDRMSYEREGAPRAGYEAKSGKKPINIAGWYPKGFVNHALEKGYRLGFQSSSDHWSTHISYGIVLAEKPDRAGILDGLKRRHTYGATDDIILDVRSGSHVMGDAFKADAAPLEVKVEGTADLEAVEVLRDSEVVATLKATGRQCNGTWTDPKPGARHYYYVRVRQKDGQLAWSSPLWVTYSR
jgi:hypothetical protein